MSMNSTNNKSKNFYFVVVSVILAGIIIEVALQGINFVILARNGATIPMLKLSVQQTPWKDTIKEDHDRLSKTRKKYVPFIEWENREFSGNHYNVGDDGVRESWNPETFDSDPKDVYVFGGSTVWGSGVRDEGTIPSFLSKSLNSESNMYRVYNQGQGAYVFKQDVIRLITLLINGERPDVVIFYGGFNDVLNIYTNGEVGGILQEQELREKFESDSVFALAKKKTISSVRSNCLTCRALAKFYRRIDPFAFEGTENLVAFEYDDDALERLAEEMIVDYQQTLTLVDGLSRQYNFDYLVFWQPSMITDNRFVGDEELLVGINFALRDENFKTIYQNVSERLDMNDKFFDISDALQERTVPVYQDSIHLSEDGNEAVAERIADIFIKKL